MFGSNALETAIGLAVVFLVLSLTATSLREMIELRLQSRAANLERGIRELLHDEDGTQIAQALYNHPLVGSLYRGTYDPARQLVARRKPATGPIGKALSWVYAQIRGRKRREGEWKRLAPGSNLPAYIPKRNIALALMDLAGRGMTLAHDKPASLTIDSIRKGIANLPNEHIKRVMLVALDDAGTDLEKARVNVERWFDASMDRVSGWYRKETQIILFVIGFLLAWIVNVDALQISRTLYQNDDMRAVIVAEAQASIDRAKDGKADIAQLVCKPPADDPVREKTQITCAQARLSELGLPIGWKGWRVQWWPDHGSSISAYPGWIASLPWTYVPGWLITAFAISLGAPFWFDLLNKMMVIRSTVKPHEKSPEESSEDRQTGKRPGGKGISDPSAP